MTPTAVVALIQRDGLTLAISRKTDHNDLGLPGGKVDPGESLEGALFRELEEEIGILPTAWEPVYDGSVYLDERRNGYCRTYRVTAWEGEPESREGAAMAWVPYERLLEPGCSFRNYNARLLEAISG